jgi:hypothetical protein
LDALKDFSQRVMTRTRALKDDLDNLVFSASAADLKLRNCFNQFLMLNQYQFIEVILLFLPACPNHATHPDQLPQAVSYPDQSQYILTKCRLL